MLGRVEINHTTGTVDLYDVDRSDFPPVPTVEIPFTMLAEDGINVTIGSRFSTVTLVLMNADVAIVGDPK